MAGSGFSTSQAKPSQVKLKPSLLKPLGLGLVGIVKPSGWPTGGVIPETSNQAQAKRLVRLGLSLFRLALLRTLGGMTRSVHLLQEKKNRNLPQAYFLLTPHSTI